MIFIEILQTIIMGTIQEEFGILKEEANLAHAMSIVTEEDVPYDLAEAANELSLGISDRALKNAVFQNAEQVEMWEDILVIEPSHAGLMADAYRCSQITDGELDLLTEGSTSGKKLKRKMRKLQRKVKASAAKANVEKEKEVDKNQAGTSGAASEAAVPAAGAAAPAAGRPLRRSSRISSAAGAAAAGVAPAAAAGPARRSTRITSAAGAAAAGAAAGEVATGGAAAAGGVAVACGSGPVRRTTRASSAAALALPNAVTPEEKKKSLVQLHEENKRYLRLITCLIPHLGPDGLSEEEMQKLRKGAEVVADTEKKLQLQQNRRRGEN